MNCICKLKLFNSFVIYSTTVEKIKQKYRTLPEEKLKEVASFTGMSNHSKFGFVYLAYNFESSSWKVFLMISLLILRAAVTRPVSGVHGSESNLSFAGISNFSRRPFFASCKYFHKNYYSSLSLSLCITKLHHSHQKNFL